MEKFERAATDRSPEIDFDFPKHQLRIRGESYPEDVNAFYGPVLEALEAYLRDLGRGACRVDFDSSSAKAIMTLLERLDDAAARGASVAIYWHYDEEDDTMEELGEEFSEDLEHAAFHLEKMPD